jgi:hypothetical protein
LTISYLANQLWSEKERKREKEKMEKEEIGRGVEMKKMFIACLIIYQLRFTLLR